MPPSQPTQRRPLVLLDHKLTTALADRLPALQQAGALVEVVDYQHLMSYVDKLRQLLHDHQIDFLLFSRNDQVDDRVSIGRLIRALGVGYSSFSGIDADQAIEQTRRCLDDYLTPGSPLDLPLPIRPPHRATNPPGTFSLVFDLEQLGGARFGLPRILRLLAKYGARATFFTTNFIPAVYRDVLPALIGHGHEVGLHGQYHEYLAGKPPAQQVAMLRQMIADFAAAQPIQGANFIFRMDAATVNALITTGLRYFVLFMEHHYRPFGYRTMPVRPLLVQGQQGSIWLAPISVETNNRPWTVVKNMLDSALTRGRAEGWPHVNILLHPFRDGSLRHLLTLERLLGYLCGTLGYAGVPVAENIHTLPQPQPASLIYYNLSHSDPQPRDPNCWPAWWQQTARYQERIGQLYQALTDRGLQPALCVEPPRQGAVFGVYPHLPPNATHTQVIDADPLLYGRNAFPATWAQDWAAGHEQELSLLAFAPKGYRQDLINAVRSARPQSWLDYRGILPETAMRLVYRLQPDRRFF